MKKLLLILTAFISVSVQAQYIKPNNSYGTISNRQSIDSTLLIPTGCGTPSLRGVDLHKAALYSDSCGKKLYLYNPSDESWTAIASGTGLDTSYFSSSATADTIIGMKNGVRFVIGIIYTHDGLINGGVVTYSGSGLTYDVTAATYRKNAVIYNSPSTSVTLATADPTYDRIDLIVADTTGNIVVVPGTASADPVTPQIDPTYGIVLTTITVKAGTTTPADVTTLTIYDENTEWATSSVNLTVNYDNTINPFHLTKAADITAASNGGYMLFTNTSVISSANYSTLKFYIRLKTSLNSKSNINVQFFNGSTAVSNLFTLSSTYLNKTTTGTYQNISIPLTAFTFTNSSFDRIRISFSGTTFSAFYMDYATLQAGVSNGGGGTQDLNFVRNVFMSGDTLKETLNGVNQTITRVATPASVSDSIAAIHKDTLFVDGKPNYMDHDTLKTHIDSMPLLTYYNVFTNQYTANSLVTKHYVDSTTGAAGGGTVTSFSKTDGFGIISSVTNPTTTPNYSARVDTSVIHSTAYNNTLYGSLSQQNTNTSNIATNTSNISTNTTNIASNTTAIGNKADKATTLTINGTTFDLSANRTWTIATGTLSGTYATRIAISSPTVGERFYQTDERIGLWQYTGTSWEFIPPAKMRGVYNFGTTLTTSVSGTGATAALTQTVADMDSSFMGAYVLTTGTTTTGRAGVQLAGNSLDYPFDTTYAVVTVFRMRFDTTTSTDNFTIRMGFASQNISTFGIDAYGTYFRIDNDSASTNVQTYTKNNAGTILGTDNTGVTQHSLYGTYNTYVIVSNSMTTKYYINGNLVATDKNPLVSGVVQVIGPAPVFCISIIKKTGTNSQSVRFSNVYSYTTKIY